MPDFAGLILANGENSKIESFDYSPPIDAYGQLYRSVTKSMWMSLARLRELGRIKKFYVRDIATEDC